MTSSSAKQVRFWPSKLRLWLDDERPAPEGFTLATTVLEAKQLIELYGDDIEIVSFDHDLGEGPTGYDLAVWIERRAQQNLMTRIEWDVHSMNPVGRERIKAAMTSAESFWAWHEGAQAAFFRTSLIVLIILMGLPTLAALARLLQAVLS